MSWSCFTVFCVQDTKAKDQFSLARSNDDPVLVTVLQKCTCRERSVKGSKGLMSVIGVTCWAAGLLGLAKAKKTAHRVSRSIGEGHSR